MRRRLASLSILLLLALFGACAPGKKDNDKPRLEFHEGWRSLELVQGAGKIAILNRGGSTADYVFVRIEPGATAPGEATAPVSASIVWASIYTSIGSWPCDREAGAPIPGWHADRPPGHGGWIGPLSIPGRGFDLPKGGHVVIRLEGPARSAFFTAVYETTFVIPICVSPMDREHLLAGCNPNWDRRFDDGQGGPVAVTGMRQTTGFGAKWTTIEMNIGVGKPSESGPVRLVGPPANHGPGSPAPEPVALIPAAATVVEFDLQIANRLLDSGKDCRGNAGPASIDLSLDDEPQIRCCLNTASFVHGGAASLEPLRLRLRYGIAGAIESGPGDPRPE